MKVNLMKNKINLLEEDLQCLIWLWRWKLLSTHALKLGVYKSKNLDRTYRRLLKLEKIKYIQTYWSRDGKFCLWQLSDKGYELLKTNYPDHFSGGYKSENPNHDFWVTAIHLGDWISGKPDKGLIYSEQELRRYETSQYPNWVPSTKINRADGYWKTNSDLHNKDALVALEVELSKKGTYRYNELGKFYVENIYISQVIWVVKSESDMKYIHKHLMRDISMDKNIHSFITVNQFIAQGWQSKIVFGKNLGKSIWDVLHPDSVPDKTHEIHQGLLDLRKKPIKSKTQTIITGADLGLNRYILKSTDYSTPEYLEPGLTNEL